MSLSVGVGVPSCGVVIENNNPTLAGRNNDIHVPTPNKTGDAEILSNIKIISYRLAPQL